MTDCIVVIVVFTCFWIDVSTLHRRFCIFCRFQSFGAALVPWLEPIICVLTTLGVMDLGM